MIDLSTYYQEKFPELFEGKNVVAVSGGLDSTVLMRSLVEVGADVVAAHVNYRLRGSESDEDEAFLKELCEELEVPLHVKTIDLKKGSGLQERARTVRYAWFDEVADRVNADRILTAHHEDDQVETVYFRLMRGAGMEGLAGIPVRRDNILRPLLYVPRKEILAYAESKGWGWREDASNTSSDYSRNRIRNEVLPKLKKQDPQIREEILGLGELAGAISEENQRNFEEFSVDHIMSRGSREEVSIEKLTTGYDTDDILYRWLAPKGYTAGTVRRIGENLNVSTGAKFPGPTGILVKDRETLVYRDGAPEEVDITIDRNDQRVEIAGSILAIEDIELPQEFNKDRKEVVVDGDKIEWPLRVRNWKDGDKMTVLGMQGRKKVSDILIDQKVSVADKGRVLVLESNGEIVWLIGYRQGEAHKLTPNSSSAVRIKFFE